MVLGTRDMIWNPRQPPPTTGKPNAALTVLDFAVRHGAIDADDEHYIEVGGWGAVGRDGTDGLTLQCRRGLINPFPTHTHTPL